MGHRLDGGPMRRRRQHQVLEPCDQIKGNWAHEQIGPVGVALLRGQLLQAKAALLLLSAYPNNPAALKAMRAQAKWRKAREFSTFLSQRIKTRRKRFIHLCARSTTPRLALNPAWRLRAHASSPRARMWAVKPNSWSGSRTSA